MISLEEFSSADFRSESVSRHGLARSRRCRGWHGDRGALLSEVILYSHLVGLGIAMVVYGILIFARKTWRELAFKSGKIEEVKVGRKKRK